ncbi:plastidial pyruvate kinase 2-like isoform X2 [Vicia villosa]|nr:plastidial pyruvate kinase 2-like isoform X2 [Vicia villosa]
MTSNLESIMKLISMSFLLLKMQKNYLKSCGADIHVIVEIESENSIPNLHSINTAFDGAMVTRGDLGAELPEEVTLLQEEIIRICRSMGKAVIVATNMLESMIVHPKHQPEQRYLILQLLFEKVPME